MNYGMIVWRYKHLYKYITPIYRTIESKSIESTLKKF